MSKNSEEDVIGYDVSTTLSTLLPTADTLQVEFFYKKGSQIAENVWFLIHSAVSPGYSTLCPMKNIELSKQIVTTLGVADDRGKSSDGF